MLRILLITGLAVIPVYFLYKGNPPPLPDLNLNEWWGPEELKMLQDKSIRPFKVNFSNVMIEDLRKRLKRRREYVPPLEGVGFEYGFNSGQTERWLRYWAKKYPFEEREKFLNRFQQYKTNIQGLDIHFLWVKPDISKDVETVPLLLLHGWPGSVREFYETIPHLTAVSEDRDYCIEVIAPSLAGFGFSDAAVRQGMGTAQMSVVMRNLMRRLGFEKFYVQGGDWGSIIGGHIATLFPQDVLGFHTNMPLTSSSSSFLVPLIGAIYPSLLFKPNEVERMYPLKDFYSMIMEELGYFHLHATKPDTIGIALTDSPAGLLVYILQIFSAWTCREDTARADGGLNLHFPKEQLIDNIMLYWAPNSINTAIRLYAETFSKKHLETKLDEIPTPVPTWLLQTKHELLYQSPLVTKFKFNNILNVTVLNEGGHFVALELPEVFADDVIRAVGEFRKWNKRNEKAEL
ncbi:juvenile hormone epoxide hydrolase-like [Battus philenor]|uniref:juvenile hormone epoxide hydrolase-like n=1 Tax=Battus philenor TaxID=42288 RepID=UPI0035D0DE2D